MKITQIKFTPLLLPFKEPYYWSHGIGDESTIVLVEVETDEGIVGIGESIGSPTAEAVVGILNRAAPVFLGQSPFDVTRLCGLATQMHFAADGTGVTPHYANLVFAGLDMALWDVIGKASGQPVHRLLGGALRPAVGYFAFLQGASADALAEDARQAVADGFQVFYMKIGRDEETDLRNVAAVREAIGDRRLRLDANEAWDTLTAIRMIRALARFEPEFIEQPTPASSIDALAHVKASVDVPIAADQSVLTAADVHDVCRRRAADIVVLGLHECGGIVPLRKAAAVAEAAGLNLCLHGVFESGITTCATNQAAATIANLDDGNQIVCQLLDEDLVGAPDLTLAGGFLDVLTGPGLGFELDRDAVARAAERFSSRAR